MPRVGYFYLDGVVGELHEEVTTLLGLEIEGSHNSNRESKLSDTAVDLLSKFCRAQAGSAGFSLDNARTLGCKQTGEGACQ